MAKQTDGRRASSRLLCWGFHSLKATFSLDLFPLPVLDNTPWTKDFSLHICERMWSGLKSLPRPLPLGRRTGQVPGFIETWMFRQEAKGAMASTNVFLSTRIADRSCDSSWFGARGLSRTSRRRDSALRVTTARDTAAATAGSSQAQECSDVSSCDPQYVFAQGSLFSVFCKRQDLL